MGKTLAFGGRDMPRVGLGTNRLTYTDANVRFIKDAIAAGVGMIDTAHLYTGGESERTISAAIAGLDTRCVVATKGGYDGGDRANLHSQIEQSLASLGVDTIDLYYLHRPDANVAIEESVAAIKEFKASGKISQIGLSQVDVALIERARKVAPIAAVQVSYNVGDRGHDDVIDYCTEQEIMFVPYYPLKGASDVELSAAAAAHDCSELQVALAWLLMRSPVVCPIPGTLSFDHLQENVGALEIQLTQDEYEAIRNGR